MVIQYLIIGALYFLRIVLRLFYLMPIDERKILFSSYEGKQYACSPKYIFEYIIKHYGSAFIYIWSVNEHNILPDEYRNIKTVKYLSFGYLFHALTAGYIVNNAAVKPYLPFRKSQVIVNTWHGGGAYKTVATDAPSYKKNIISMMVARKKTSMMVKYVISSCEKFTDVSSKVWAIQKEKFLPIGMPRNDILFNMPDSLRKKVKDYFRLRDDKKIVLYAPTFRGNYRNADVMTFFLDASSLLRALNDKFYSDFLFLYRFHMYSKNKPDKDNGNIISAFNYPDMQELLCAADILITDYSSCIWDFSFTYKPCFLYAPDVKKYREEQGFYTPIEEWPFPLAETNEQLVENIINFDEEKYKYAVKKHHADLGSYETGTACEQLCGVLFSTH
jgi:CDP-glycerol glycerophosphotransferase